MPQTTIAKLGQVTTTPAGTLGVDWNQPSAPTVAMLENDDNNTVRTNNFTLAASPSDLLNGLSFGVLAGEDATRIVSGQQIPAGASILGVRMHFAAGINGSSADVSVDYNWSGGTQRVSGNTPGGGAGFDALHTFGYGTLKGTTSGLNWNMGDTFNGNNLNTEAGQLAARSALAGGSFGMSMQARNQNALTGATATADMMRVEVQWVLRLNKTGVFFGEGVQAATKKSESQQTAALISTGVSSGSRKMEYTEGGGLVIDDAVAATLRLTYNSKQAALVSSDSELTSVDSQLKNKTGAVVSEDGELDASVRVYTYTFAGFVYDEGVPVSGATVELFHTASGDRVATTTSAADGSYSFTRRSDSGEHFVYAYKDAPEQEFGATARNLVVDEVEIPR